MGMDACRLAKQANESLSGKCCHLYAPVFTVMRWHLTRLLPLCRSRWHVGVQIIWMPVDLPYRRDKRCCLSAPVFSVMQWHLTCLLPRWRWTWHIGAQII